MMLYFAGNLDWVTTVLTPEISACRFSKGSAASSGSGGHLAASWWEQGGSPNAVLLLAGCGGLCGREPDDSHQHRRLSGAVAFPPEQHEERHQSSQVICSSDFLLVFELSFKSSCYHLMMDILYWHKLFLLKKKEIGVCDIWSSRSQSHIDSRYIRARLLGAD